MGWGCAHVHARLVKPRLAGITGFIVVLEFEPASPMPDGLGTTLGEPESARARRNTRKRDGLYPVSSREFVKVPGSQALHVMPTSSARYSPERQGRTATFGGATEVLPETAHAIDVESDPWQVYAGVRSISRAGSGSSLANGAGNMRLLDELDTRAGRVGCS